VNKPLHKMLAKVLTNRL